VLQPARGFSDEEWTDAERSLLERGLLLEDRRLSEAGQTLRREVEAATDDAAAAPWARLDDEGCRELTVLLAPLHDAIAASGVVPPLNPIGLPSE